MSLSMKKSYQNKKIKNIWNNKKTRVQISGTINNKRANPEQ